MLTNLLILLSVFFFLFQIPLCLFVCLVLALEERIQVSNWCAFFVLTHYSG